MRAKTKGLLLAALLPWAGAATAADVFAEVGMAYHKETPCYLWNQRCAGFETEDNLSALYVRAGLRMELTEHTSVSASIFSLGRHKMSATAANDEPCVKEHGESAKDVCGSTQDYRSEGTAVGIALTLLHRAGPFEFELGPTYVKRTFMVETNDGTGFKDRMDLCDQMSHKAAGMGYMFGGKYYTTRNSYVSVTYFNDNVGGAWPSGMSAVYVLSVGKRF